MTCPNHNFLLIISILQDCGDTDICLDITALIQKIQKLDIPNYV